MVWQLQTKTRTLTKKKKIALLKDCIAVWKKGNPSPSCELYYSSPYQLLVSVVLSAQATDFMVNRVMKPLYQAGFDQATVLALKEEGFYQQIKSIGLAPTKAKNIYALTVILTRDYGGKIPHVRSQLEALPGVGRKTASVILAELFGQACLAVDTHVFRVSTRLGLQAEKNPKQAEQALLALVPAAYLPKLHHWFILHGRYVCKARKPLCPECKLRFFCPSAKDL